MTYLLGQRRRAALCGRGGLFILFSITLRFGTLVIVRGQILFLKLSGGVAPGLGVQNQVAGADFPLHILRVKENRDRGKYSTQEFAAWLDGRISGLLRIAIPGQQLIAVHAGIDGLWGNGLVGEQGGDTEDFNFSMKGIIAIDIDILKFTAAIIL